MMTGTQRGRNQTGKGRWCRFRRVLCTAGLLLCLALGRDFKPANITAAGSRIFTVLDSRIALSSALTELGRRAPSADDLRAFCVTVFGGQETTKEGETSAVFLPRSPQAHTGLLSSEICPEELFSSLLSEVPAAGTVLTRAEPSLQPLPEGHTLDELSLGDLETVAPVLGHLNSGYGFREHPVSGKQLFHSGADISADFGDPIGAFADGRVEYIGEDDSYGLYLQLDHGNGVKSFYAHCRSILVSPEQQVLAGETVALVGDTGTATGPHLHLELKCGDLRVDPAYYMEFLGG